MNPFSGQSAAARAGTAGRALRRLGAPDARSVLPLAALALGLMLAGLPLPVSAAIIGGGTVVVLALLEPLVALAVMLLLGLAEPLLAVAYPIAPLSPGQIGVALFGASWLLRGMARREIRWPALPITVPFVVYWLAAALSLAVVSPRSPLDGAQELIKWAEMLVVAAIVVDVAGRKRRGWLVAVLLAVGMVQAGIGLWQFQFRGHGPAAFRILGDHYRAYGTLEQPNPFGGLMGMVWPVAAAVALTPKPAGEGRRARAIALRAAAALAAAAATGALFLSFSRGAWLGAAAAALAMLAFWPRRRAVGLGLAAVALAGVLLLHSLGLLPAAIASRFAEVGDFAQVRDARGVHINDANFSIVERLAHWQAAWNMAQSSPAFGVGFGNYEAAYDEFRLVNWPYALGHAHMIYLNVLAETGAVGLAAYLVLWGAIAAITLRTIGAASGLDRALAVGALGAWVHLSTHQLLDNLYVGNIPLYLGALVGLLCLVHSGREPSPVPRRSTRYL